MTRWATAAVLLLFLAALALRWPGIEDRPLHNDEAVNGVKFSSLWHGEGYRYDPHEYHGPTLPYATLPVAWLRLGGDRRAEPDELALRLVPLIFGLALVLIPLLSRGALGTGPTLAAISWTALSPAMVYYSRYYIHELLLVGFVYVFLVAAWRLCGGGTARWTWVSGIALGLLMATKETFVLSLAASAAAAGITVAWNRWNGEPTTPGPRRVPWGQVAVAVILGLAVAALLFSSFLTNPGGPIDAIRTYLPWLNRAGGASPHVRPWYFYAERLLWFHFPRGPVWTEAVILLLAIVGLGAAIRRRLPAGTSLTWTRFLGLHALLLAGTYSIIGYKTPWCALQFWQPIIVLAGVGTVVAINALRPAAARWALGIVLLAGAGHLGWQAWQASHHYSWRRQNPWVFAHTSADILNLVERVRKLAELSSDGRKTVVKVMAPDDDYWPLPWYLRDFRHVGYYPALPPDPMAPIIIASVQFQAALETRPDRSHIMAGLYELRPQPAGVPSTTFELYVAMDLWKAYLKAHPPRPDED